MVGIYFRNNYASNSLGYQLFADRSRNEFENFALRVGGSDWGISFMRDALAMG